MALREFGSSANLNRQFSLVSPDTRRRQSVSFISKGEYLLAINRCAVKPLIENGFIGDQKIIIQKASNGTVEPQRKNGERSSDRNPIDQSCMYGKIVPEKATILGMDLQGLDRNSLNNFTEQTRTFLNSDVLPLLGDTTDLHALSVGSGLMLEAQGFLQACPEGKYFGIDIADYREISRTIGVIREEDEPAGKINFSLENAANIDPDNADAYMNHKWRLILGRNIEFAESATSSGTKAMKILDNSIDVLTSGGVLVLTHFDKAESSLGLNALREFDQQKKIKIIKTGTLQNPDSSHHVPMQDEFFSLAIKIAE